MRGLPDQGNEAVVTLPKSAEAETEPSAALGSFEVKPAPEPAAAETMPYDLTSFMGKMDEFAEEGTQPAEDTQAPLPGGGQDLDTLLSDIENMDDKLNR